MAVDNYGFVEVNGVSKIGNASSLTNPIGHLILSSSVGRTVTVSGSVSMPSGSLTITSGGIYVDSTNGAVGLTVAGGSQGLVVRYTPSSGIVAQFGTSGDAYFVVRTSAQPFCYFGNNFGIINGGGTIDYINSYQARGNWAFTAATTFGTITLACATGSIYTNTGHLILSSTAGSIVAISASQDFVNVNKSYSIHSVGSHLILTSSMSRSDGLTGNGGVIAISGNLVLPTFGNSSTSYIEARGASARGYRFYSLGDQGFSAVGLKINGEGGGLTANLMLDQDYLVQNGGGPISIALGNASTLATAGALPGLRLNKTSRITWRADSDLNTTGTPQANLMIGRFDTGSLYISGSGNNAFVAKDAHLVLSATMGSLVVSSGNFKSTGYASASLPNPIGNVNVPSGTISFVTDLGAGILAVAFNGSWHRITTGSF